MRPVAIGQPPRGGSFESWQRWVESALAKIAAATQDISPEKIADGFTVENLTPTRAIDCDTAADADIADVLGTLIADLKTRGPKRTST